MRPVQWHGLRPWPVTRVGSWDFTGSERRAWPKIESPSANISASLCFRVRSLRCSTPNSSLASKFMGLYGNGRPFFGLSTCCVGFGRYCLNQDIPSAIVAPNLVLKPPCTPGLVAESQKFLLIPMKSHVIPYCTDEDGPKTSGRQDPKRQKSGFIQAPAFIEPRDPAL